MPYQCGGDERQPLFVVAHAGAGERWRVSLRRLNPPAFELEQRWNCLSSWMGFVWRGVR